MVYLPVCGQLVIQKYFFAGVVIIKNTFFAGVAYVSAICSNFRTSINEEHGHDYWIMTTVAAHELAHK